MCNGAFCVKLDNAGDECHVSELHTHI